MDILEDITLATCPDDGGADLAQSMDQEPNVSATVPSPFYIDENNVHQQQQQHDEGLVDCDDIQQRLMELRYEVLDNNSQAIYLTQCQDFDGAEKILVDTFNKIVQVEKNVSLLSRTNKDDNKNIWRVGSATSNRGTNATTTQDPTELHKHEDNITAEVYDGNSEYSVEIQLLDQLKSTTLTNVSFVVYHKGMLRDALAHLESAQELDSKYGVQSPVSFINLCVVLNAIGNYPVATQHALQAIDILRRTAELPSGVQHDPSATAHQQSGEKMKLWGAAWHNLAISQLQLVDPTDKIENSNIVLMFENSMAATNEQLGHMHPMSRSVTETYRIVRKELKSRGAYIPHYHSKTTTTDGKIKKLHTFFSQEALMANLGGSGNETPRHFSAYTGKCLKPPTLKASTRTEDKQMSVVLRSKENIKYVEKIDTEPYIVPPVHPSQYSHKVPTTTRELEVYQRGVEEARRLTEKKQMVQDYKAATRHLTRGEPLRTSLLSFSGRAPHPPSQRDRMGSAHTRGQSNMRHLVKSGSSGIQLRGNLALAGVLYSNPHPLTQMNTPRRGLSNRQYTRLGVDSRRRNGDMTYSRDGRVSNNRCPSNSPIYESSLRLPPLQTGAGKSLQRQQNYNYSGKETRQIGSGDGKGRNASPQQSQISTKNNITNNNSNSTSPKRGMSELLIGDMWVDAPVIHPRNSPSAGKDYYKHSHPPHGHYCSYLASRRYTQPMYSLDPADRVVDPVHYSHPDSGLRVSSSSPNDHSDDMMLQ